MIEPATSEPSFEFLDEFLQYYFGSEVGSCPSMRPEDVEKLLADDTRRRVAQVRIAAVEWGNTEIDGDVVIASDHLVITPYGVLYAAGLIGAGERLHYFATPPTLFQPIADRVGAMSMAPRSAAAVDTRLGHELTFPWPIDADLRRLLDAHSVLRLELTGS